MKLPVAAWPYGRIVAVQDIGVKAGDRSDGQLIAANLESSLAVLKQLKVMVYRWPS